MSHSSLVLRFRVSLGFFIFGLVVSGVTAFPLLSELRILCHFIGVDPAANPTDFTGLKFWISTVNRGLEATYTSYPWIAYGTDWLAFGHIVIAAFFIGPLLQPLTSRFTLYTGIFACVAVVPLAMICGPLRGIPFHWRLLDCTFGAIGMIPLIYCLSLLRKMESRSIPTGK